MLSLVLAMDTTLKILLIMPFFYPHRGGSQKYAEDIYIQIMKTHPNVCVDVLTYNTDNVRAFEKYKGMNIYRVPCFNVIPTRFALPHPIALLKQLKELRNNKYDIVNTHIRFFDPTWWVWKYAKSIVAKSFFTGHVATHPVYQSKAVEGIAKIVDLTIARYSLNKYDLITYVSNTTKEFFEKKLKTHVKGEVVYGSVDTSSFYSTKTADTRTIPKTNTSVKNNKIIISYVGRVIWTKGITYLYEAVKELSARSEFKNCVVVIGGPGELEDTLRKSIQKDHLENQVIITGSLNYAEVKELLAISDIYINPSHHSEGFPITILEAGASECFVIATDNAGTKEVIQTGQTGLRINQKSIEDIKKSLLWAIEEKDKRLEMAKNLKNTVKEKFDIKITAEKLYNIIYKAIKE